MIKMSNAEYQTAIAEGRTTHLHGLTSNRASAITVGSVIYTEDSFREVHGYTWKSTPTGAIWYYRAEDGTELEVNH